MTKQEAFNRVWKEFVTLKGQPSVSPQGYCRYRSYTGAKCAIGHLIPDSLYSPNFESCGIYTLVGMFPEVMEEALGTEVHGLMTFYSDLQNCHDEAVGKHFHSKVEANLKRLAEQYQLQIPVTPLG